MYDIFRQAPMSWHKFLGGDVEVSPGYSRRSPSLSGTAHHHYGTPMTYRETRAAVDLLKRRGEYN